jgi:hypothetical protein
MVGGDNFKPEGLLTGKFGEADWTVGANLTANQTENFPSFFVNPNGGSTAFDNTTQLYSAILVDAGVVGTNGSQTLHWLINTIHVNTTGGAPFALNYDNGTTITEYAGPAPPANQGPHRYVLGLFQQGADFAAPEAYSQRNTAVGPFNLAQYLEQSKLGNLVAANYFTVANGQIPENITATTAVQSSTLEGYTGAAAIPTAAGAQGGGANGTAGGNGTEGGNGTGTGSGNGTNPSDPAANPNSGALGSFPILAPAAAILAAVAGAVSLF